MGIATLGHIELECPDFEESCNHYKNVTGLDEIDREGDSVYMRAWGDFNKYSTILTKTDGKKDVGHIAFRVEDPEDLHEYEQRVEESGYDVKWQDADVEPGQGESIRFSFPGEQTIELFYDIEKPDIPADKQSKLLNQPQKEPGRGVAPRRIDHVNLCTPDVKECSNWLRDVLDFKLREQTVVDGEPMLRWLSVSPLVHEIAFVNNPKNELHHHAYYMKTRSDLFNAADTLRETGTPINAGPAKHGVTQANCLYYWEPSGHMIEAFADGYLIFEPDWDPVTWEYDTLEEAMASDANMWWGGNLTHPHEYAESEKYPGST